MGALEILLAARLALEHWPECLQLLEEIEATQESLGEGKHELARTRFNRYGPLLRLGHLDDAKRLLEDCLGVFREVDDLANQARALTALADLWDESGDSSQAVALERQALAVSNRLPALADRAISHGNLSNYLGRLGDLEGMAQQSLAAIAYDVTTNHRQDLAVRLENLAVDMRRAAAGGSRYELPRLPDLLARPEFTALKETLAAGGVDLVELQSTIDALVEQVRSQAEAGG